MTIGARFACAVLLAVTTPATAAELPAPAKTAVDAIVATERAELHGTAMADLDGDGVDEVVVVWSGIGGPRPKKALVVLGRTGDVYRQVASMPLTGEVTLGSVQDGVIVVERYPLKPPKCCPSKKYHDRYMLMAGRIVDAR